MTFLVKLFLAFSFFCHISFYCCFHTDDSNVFFFYLQIFKIKQMVRQKQAIYLVRFMLLLFSCLQDTREDRAYFLLSFIYLQYYSSITNRLQFYFTAVNNPEDAKNIQSKTLEILTSPAVILLIFVCDIFYLLLSAFFLLLCMFGACVI